MATAASASSSASMHAIHARTSDRINAYPRPDGIDERRVKPPSSSLPLPDSKRATGREPGARHKPVHLKPQLQPCRATDAAHAVSGRRIRVGRLQLYRGRTREQATDRGVIHPGGAPLVRRHSERALSMHPPFADVELDDVVVHAVVAAVDVIIHGSKGHAHPSSHPICAHRPGRDVAAPARGRATALRIRRARTVRRRGSPARCATYASGTQSPSAVRSLRRGASKHCDLQQFYPALSFPGSRHDHRRSQ